MKWYFVLLALGSIIALNAQDYYWVEFLDKKDSEYSLTEAHEFLSEKAIIRRQYFNIPIQQSDLPLVKKHVHTILALEAILLKKSKWLNAMYVNSSNPNFESLAKALPFVKNVRKIEQPNTKNKADKYAVHDENTVLTYTDDEYGFAWNNINTINGQFLHDNGFLGEPIDIAVMDNGFLNVNTNPYFENIRLLGNLHSAYDFVHNDTDVYSSGEHGAYVMSTLAAYNKDTLIGTAPQANYYLFTTEDQAAEGLPEEINWAMAAEWADSALGTWVVLSTSLGYLNGFDDPSTNHTYNDMDGNTTIITRAADLAAQKGMLVINSAGNEGISDWYHIIAPADGDSVLAIGAIDKDLEMAEFSSYGPSADGRTKPNVAALGKGVIAISPYNELKSISGTSFSCPITSGMAACLWQAFPLRNNMEIMEAIEQSAHLYYSPEHQYGYGIPNFEIAYKILEAKRGSDSPLFLYPNPVKDELKLIFANKGTEDKYHIIVSDVSGKICYEQKEEITTFTDTIYVRFLPKGVYYINVTQGKERYRSKFVKH